MKLQSFRRMLLRAHAAGRSAICFAVAALSLLLGPSQAWASAGTVESIVGTGRIIRPHGHERPAMKGDTFYEGDTIVTLANSNLKLRMVDDAQIWLRPDTRLKVEKYTSAQRGASRDEARLQLIAGSLREVTGTIGKASPSDYRLATPNATIGIRGTDFDAVFVSPQEASQLGTQAGTYNRVYVGSTALSGPAGQVVLGSGQAGFMGLAASAPPQVLPGIPSFLNNLAPTGTPTTSSVSRSLQITVRTGDNPGAAGGSSVTSTRATSPAAPTEQRVRVTEGGRAQISLALAAPPGRPSTQVTMEVQANLTGNQAQVSLRMQSPGAGPLTTVSTALGNWTEITGNVAGTGNSANAVTSSQPGDRRVFLRVDEVDR
jgi:hypothetical protein